MPHFRTPIRAFPPGLQALIRGVPDLPPARIFRACFIWITQAVFNVHFAEAFPYSGVLRVADLGYLGYCKRARTFVHRKILTGYRVF